MWRAVLIICICFLLINNGVKASFCERLEQRNRHVPKQRYVSIQDKLKNVSIYWSIKESRATSALLAVLLKYVVGYQGVYLHQKSHEAVLKNEVIVALTDSLSDVLPNVENNTPVNCYGNAFSLRHFYVHIPHKFRNLKQCDNAASWTFYHNFTALKDCGFFSNASGNLTTENESRVSIYALNEENAKIIKTFSSNIVPVGNITVKGCLEILQMLTVSTHSFLFYDDDIWSGNPDVSKILLPSCEDVASTYKEDKNTFIKIRLINPSLILEYAPSIYQIGYLEFPSKYFKVIIEKENSKKDIEEAACEWALENIIKVREWIEQTFTLYENQYNILHFYDDREHDSKLHITLPRLLAYQLTPVNFNSKSTFTFGFYHYAINSMNKNYINDVLDNFMNDKHTCLIRTRQQLLGAVVGIKQNTLDFIQSIKNTNLPIILYDGIGVDIESQKYTWLATGNTFHLALALQNFVVDMNFSHIDVISETTETAKMFIKNIQEVGGLDVRDYPVESKFFQSEAKWLLLKMKTNNARIIFVNTNHEKALIILTVAKRLKMNSDFVWIVRDWRPNTVLNLTCIHLSFLYENIKYVKDNDGWLEFRQAMKNNLWPNIEWPIQAPALVDALVTLVKGFEAIFKRYPHKRHDIHSDFAIREFERSIVEEKILGVTQNLIYDYKKRILENTVMILEEWNGNQSKMLAKYRVYVRARVVNIVNMAPDYFKYAKTYDGEKVTECFIINTYIFQKICYDVLIYALVGVFLTIIILRLMFNILSRPIYQQVNR